MSEESKEAKDDEPEIDPELAEEIQHDVEASTPGPDAPAEPYYAIMVVEDGKTTGEMWSLGPRIMIFYEDHVANKVLAALDGGSGPKWELRGVTEDHLIALEHVSKSTGAAIFVVAGFTMDGKMEAVPLEEHVQHKKATPPPLPPTFAKAASGDEDESEDEDEDEDEAEDASDDEDGEDADDDDDDDDEDEED